MEKSTFSSLAYDAKKKPTQRERPLAEMEQAVPWADLEAVIAPRSPTLSDLAMEDALYEIESMRCFAGLELLDDAIPDETMILKFWRLLKTHGLTA